MADAFVTCIDLYMASAFGRTSITDDDKWLRTHSWLAEMAPARGISLTLGVMFRFLPAIKQDARTICASLKVRGIFTEERCGL